MGKAEERRRQIIERTLARKKAEEVEAEIEAIINDDPDTDVGDIEIDEGGNVQVIDAFDDEDLEDFEDDAGGFNDSLLEMFYNEGQLAYRAGATLEEVPYSIEDLAEEEMVEIAQATWQEGWMDMHQQSWIATALISAKRFFEAENEEEIAVAAKSLKEALDVLEDGIIDFAELEEEFGA